MLSDQKIGLLAIRAINASGCKVIKNTAPFGTEVVPMVRHILDEYESAATAPLLARIAALDETLRFVERWANHHGTKPNMTPDEVLSCIQHYPAIRAITHSYADGQMPDTPNPWKQIKELQSYVSSLERELVEARKDAELLDYIQTNGATVEIIPGAPDFYPVHFRVGGRYRTANESIRAAIRAAIKEQT